MIDPSAPDFRNAPVSPQRPYFHYATTDVSAPPYVTIITPFYNTGPVFHETARSVLQQSFQQWEWLIVNDGSTEPDALALLADYRHKDPRIRVIDHPENRGLSAARNTGFREACTDYVVQLDSDDLLEPTAVEKWRWFLMSHPEFAFCKGYSVGFEGTQYLWQGGFHEGEAFLEENRVDSVSMVRRVVQHAVGGYDEANRNGFEDWDFWLRCASFGYWGGTIPEYLNWYRRRPRHSDRWSNWDSGAHQEAFREQLRQRYPQLWNAGFPQIHPRAYMPNDSVPDTLPCENRLHKTKPRLLMLLPWLTMGGSDKFNLDLLQQLTARGWEVSIATTLQGDHPWLPLFARHTPDLFILEHFLRLVDYPRFLRYLIQSRQVDVVMVSHSELGYLLLPYLHIHFPDVTFVDFSHMEEEQKSNLYLRMAVEYQELLDLNIVSSQHLKRSMILRGADPERIEVSHTNVDPGERMVALFERARSLPVRRPRPRLGAGLGQACAARAVEYSRLSREAEQKIQEQEARIGELERAKAWVEEERASLQRLAEERQAWIGEIERAKAWLEEERASLQRLTEERQAWIGELERAKAWLEEQRGNWQRIAEERESVINALRQSFWVRFGLRLGFLKAPAEVGSRPARNTDR